MPQHRRHYNLTQLYEQFRNDLLRHSASTHNNILLRTSPANVTVKYKSYQNHVKMSQYYDADTLEYVHPCVDVEEAKQLCAAMYERAAATYDFDSQGAPNMSDVRAQRARSG